MENAVTIRQDNVLTSSRFEYTALERNLFYSVLGQLKKSDTSETLYYISVSDLAKSTGQKCSGKEYKDATLAILGRVYEINQDNGNLLQVSMFSSCEYKTGQAIIEVEISQKLRPYLFEIKNNFTSMQLEVALGFNSKFSKRIYEVVNQYKNIDRGIKEFELLKFKEILNLYNPKTKEEQYESWSAFEKYVLKVAQKEMDSANCDVTFTYTTEKRGRKIHKIIFTIKSKSYQKVMEFNDGATDLFRELVKTCELRKDQAQKVIDTMSEDEIKTKIRMIKIAKRDGKITKTVGGFSASTFGLLKN